MIKKVVIYAENSIKALAFFDKINKRKEEAKKKSDEKTARVRELLSKKSDNS